VIKVLITGGGGFLGGHLVAQAAGRFDVLATHRNRPPGQRPASSVQIDLADAASVNKLMDGYRPQIIIHAAANSRLDECEAHPQSAFRDNVAATQNLASAAEKFGARFIYISTDMVFDGSGQFYRETNAPAPLSVYGRSKLEAEPIVCRLPNYVIVRSALIYGRPADGGSSFSDWIENKLRNREPVPLYTDQFRTPILVENLSEILLELAESKWSGLLHTGGSARLDRFSFGRQLCDIAGYDAALLQPISMDDHRLPAPRPRDLSLCIEKAQLLLKTPILGVREGLSRMINGASDV
jgi:dTDP-4-dehydrorhamnose reductase